MAAVTTSSTTTTPALHPAEKIIAEAPEIALATIRVSGGLPYCVTKTFRHSTQAIHEQTGELSQVDNSSVSLFNLVRELARGRNIDGIDVSDLPLTTGLVAARISHYLKPFPISKSPNRLVRGLSSVLSAGRHPISTPQLEILVIAPSGANVGSSSRITEIKIDLTLATVTLAKNALASRTGRIGLLTLLATSPTIKGAWPAGAEYFLTLARHSNTPNILDGFATFEAVDTNCPPQPLERFLDENLGTPDARSRITTARGPSQVSSYRRLSLGARQKIEVVFNTASALEPQHRAGLLLETIPNILPDLKNVTVAEIERLQGFCLESGAADLAELVAATVAHAADSHIAYKPNFRAWINPLSRGDLILGEVRQTLQRIGASDGDIPMAVRLVENPEFDMPGTDIFPGRVSLAAHDYAHILLGRGLLKNDEAFVIGFTMGSTDRMSTWKENVFAAASKYIYSGPFKFNDEQIFIFRRGVALGLASECEPLDKVDYPSLLHLPIDEARERIGIEKPLIAAWAAIEKAKFPRSLASRRLLD